MRPQSVPQDAERRDDDGQDERDERHREDAPRESHHRRDDRCERDGGDGKGGRGAHQGHAAQPEDEGEQQSGYQAKGQYYQECRDGFPPGHCGPPRLSCSTCTGQAYRWRSGADCRLAQARISPMVSDALPFATVRLSCQICRSPAVLLRLSWHITDAICWSRLLLRSRNRRFPCTPSWWWTTLRRTAPVALLSWRHRTLTW